MIEPNNTFAVGDKTIRILGFDASRDLYWAIKLGDELAQPYKGHTPDLLEKLALGTAQPIDDPTLAEAIPESELSEKAKARLEEKLFPAMQFLQSTAPDIYVPSLRSKRVREATERFGLSAPTVRKNLRRFLQGGGTKAAIAPRFHNCGSFPIAPKPEEEERLRKRSRTGNIKAQAGSKKRGRHRGFGQSPGMGVTENDVELMVDVWDSKKRRKLNQKVLRSVYRQYKNLHLTQIGVDPKDHEAHQAAIAAGRVPTYEQFFYHIMRHIEHTDLAVFRKLCRSIERKKKLIHSKSYLDAPLPGYRYQIDATVADIYLVSKQNPTRIVGRPTLYLVVDVATTMIVGYHLSFDKPSWGAALMALANVCEDKVAHCAKYGVTIAPEDWPTAPMPAHILGDRGEMLSYVVSGLAHHFGVDVENAPPYFAQAKAVVERGFGTVQPQFTEFAPGAVEDREFGEDDYRLSAALNIDELRSIILRSIVISNVNPKGGLILPEEAVDAGIPSIPVKLWQYFRNNGQVLGKHFSPETVALYARPRRPVTVTRAGIRLTEDLRYESPELTAAPWYAEAVVNKLKLEAIYDPLDMTEILVRHPTQDNVTVRCTLVPACSRFAGRSWREVTKMRRSQKRNTHAHMPEAEAKASILHTEMLDLIDAAKARHAALADPNQSKAERLSGIAENQTEERREDKLRNRPNVIDGECSTEEPVSLPQPALPEPAEPDEPYLDALSSHFDIKGDFDENPA